MFRFFLVAVVAFVLPGALYYLWRLFAPSRFGGSPALVRGERIVMPWRILAIVGAVSLAVALTVFVSLEGERAPPSVLLQGTPTPFPY